MKKMSEKELQNFWKNYRPSEAGRKMGQELAAALNAGVVKQQREDADRLQKAPKPFRK